MTKYPITPQELHDTDQGDLMTINIFKEQVRHGVFTNDDGTGYFCIPKDYSSRDMIDCRNIQPRPEHTHVIWFSK